jgi:NifU-like protein
MSFYPESVNELFLAPLNVGEVKNASAAGTTASFVCGAVLRLTMRVDSSSSSRIIVDAKFKAAGCGFLIAAASLFTDTIKRMSMDEVATLCSHPERIESALLVHLQDVPEERRHCLRMCRDALQSALESYRSLMLEEWHGDEALICTCFGVSETTIEDTIKAGALQTVSEVTRACNAGGGCGSCHPLIEDILDDYWRTAQIGQ